MQGQCFFSKLGGAGSSFSGGFKKIPGGGNVFAGGLPLPGSDIPRSSCGGTLTSLVGGLSVSLHSFLSIQLLYYEGKENGSLTLSNVMWRILNLKQKIERPSNL